MFRRKLLRCAPLLLLMPETGGACSCREAPLAHQVAAAQLVFSGSVVAATGSDRGDFPRSAFFAVEEVFKGPEGASAIWVYNRDSGCWPPFVEGQRYLVFARCLFRANRIDVVSLGICGGTLPMAPGRAAAEIPRATSAPVTFVLPALYVGFFALHYAFPGGDDSEGATRVEVPASGVVELPGQPPKTCDTRFYYRDPSGRREIPPSWVHHAGAWSTAEEGGLRVRDYYWVGPPDRYRKHVGEPQPGSRVGPQRQRAVDGAPAVPEGG